MIRIAAIVLLPMIYAILTFLHSDFNFEKETYARVVFPILFGMLPIVLIAICWTLSIKEYRVRRFVTLPVKPIQVILGRSLTAALPLVYLLLFGLIILIPLDPASWEPITGRILYQYGAIALMVATFYVAFELINLTLLQTDVAKILIGIPVFAVSIATLFIVDSKLWHQIHQSNIGLVYAVFGSILILLGGYIYSKRKNYLV